MARPLRIEPAGGLYHVTSRGDRREAICFDDEDRRDWLATVLPLAGRPSTPLETTHCRHCLTPDTNMKIDVSYHPEQDRVRLCLRTDQQRSDWWLTRRITIRLLEGWLGKLEQVPLPTVDAEWMPRNPQRLLDQEHALSLEFDAVSIDPSAPQAGAGGLLVSTINLTVSPTESRLALISGTNKAALSLTRKESHAFMEALAQRARQADWLKACRLPDWLGNLVG